MMRTANAGLMVMAVALAACGSFGAEDRPVALDAGPGSDTSVPSVAEGQVDLALPKGLVLVHDQSVVIDVKVTRKPPFTKGMTITARGLPVGLGSEAVDLTPYDSVAKVKLVVGKEVPQGRLVNVTIEASSGGEIVGKAALDATVNGSAGELDTTFGTAGHVDMDADYNGLAMRADGSFYVLGQNTIRKYAKDGVLDATFATAGIYTAGVATPMSAIAWKDPYLFVAGATPIAPFKWYVRRLTASGQVDTTYGAAGSYERTSAGGPNQLRGLAIGPNGEALLAGGIGPLGTLVSVTAAGTNVGQTEWTPPSSLSGALWDGARSVAVADQGYVVGAISANQMFDNAFAVNGSLSTYGAASLTSIVSGGAGKYLVGGIDSATQQLFVERLDAPAGGAGSFDTTFNSVGYLLTGITTSAGGGDLAVAADQKIVQTATVSVGPAYRCLVARYTSDGKLDATFGEAGKSIPVLDDCFAGQVAMQPDGRIVVAGRKLLRFWP